ncbi:hypothetical protein [uncultured Nocardioides sp.]|uniref:hypothetical protein n=1 Tax=uncultured Nocardioides sp. TaxID=198441 RepID=UPI00262D26C0|nr:hypothetical protein [uncultured Nocardioides sp.]
MTPRPGRRTAALVTGLGLAAGSLLVAPVAPASAAAPNDSAAAVAGGDWLADQLTDGVIYNDQFAFDDYGLTVDTGLALDDFSSNRYAGALRSLTAAVTSDEGVESYTTGNAFGDENSRYAGATAKLASYVQQRGGDPRDVSGTNLINQLSGLVATEDPIAGRIEDRTSFGDTANAIGQGFAARALVVADSPRGASAMDFFLDQQCSDGFFRAFLDDKADTDQTCDGATSEEDSAPNTDTTGIAVLNLLATDPAPGSPVQDAIDSAVDWMLSEQAPDGSYAGAPPTDVPNTNSTGVVAWALGQAGENGAAARAAAYIARQQATACDGALRTEVGTVAYDRAALEAGRESGIDATNRDQFRRASAQAVPALRSLGAVKGSLAQARATRFVKAGQPLTLEVSGLTRGTRSCLTGPATRFDVPNAADREVTVDVPSGTANRTYRLSTFAQKVDSVTVRALDKTTLAANVAKSRVARKAQQTVTVKRLAAQERVTVKVDGTRVARGTANGNGVFRATYRVTGPKGDAAMKVVGQFGNRTGATSYVVR